MTAPRSEPVVPALAIGQAARRPGHLRRAAPDAADPHVATPVDFLFTYEHKTRELEALALICNELARRGYTVGLSNTYHPRRIDFTERRRAGVVVTPALYNDASLFAFVYRVAGACRKVVNLQWEQALTNQDERDPAFFQNPKGRARLAVHLCWGEEPRQRLLRAGVPPERAVVAGPVQLDALRPELRRLHPSRDALAADVGLPPDREWVLFISSFTYVNMPAEEFETELACVGPWLADFRRISAASQATILAWLTAACQRHPEKVFIYRPHPSETADPALLALTREHSNFRVIGERSVRQWILAADRIFTWYSTAAAEVFVARKPCAILRPVPIPEPLDVSFFRGATFVERYEEFLAGVEAPVLASSLDPALLHRYFAVDPATPAYVRVCDLLETVLRTPTYDMPPIGVARRLGYYLHWLRHRLFFVVKTALTASARTAGIRRLSWLRRKLENHDALMERMDANRGRNLASPAELEALDHLITAIREERPRDGALRGSCRSSS